MYCSPDQEQPTSIPRWLRDRLAGFVRGPAAASNRRRFALGVFALGRVGDFVLQLSAIRLLIERFGAGNTLLVVPEPVEFLAWREFPGTTTVALPAEAGSLTREIFPLARQHRARLAEFRVGHRVSLCHQRSLYHELVLSWLAADRDHRLVRATYPHDATADVGTELLAHRRLVEHIVRRPVALDEVRPRLTSVPTSDHGALLVFPLSHDPARNLPPSMLVSAVEAWMQRHPGKPVVLGGVPAEGPQLERLLGLIHVPGARVETPAGIPGLIDLIAGARAVFAADSGPAHVATALDKRTVTVTTRKSFGHCQPWKRSPRQDVFVLGASADAMVEAVVKLGDE